MTSLGHFRTHWKAGIQSAVLQSIVVSSWTLAFSGVTSGFLIKILTKYEKCYPNQQVRWKAAAVLLAGDNLLNASQADLLESAWYRMSLKSSSFFNESDNFTMENAPKPKITVWGLADKISRQSSKSKICPVLRHQLGRILSGRMIRSLVYASPFITILPKRYSWMWKMGNVPN